MLFTVTKRSLHAIAFLALLATVLIGALGIWLAAEERSILPWVPYLKKMTEDSGYQWDVREARLHLRGVKRTLASRMSVACSVSAKAPLRCARVTLSDRCRSASSDAEIHRRSMLARTDGLSTRRPS